MMFQILNSKINKWVIAIFCFANSFNLFSQSTEDECCNVINFSFNYTINYSGTNAIVQFTPNLSGLGIRSCRNIQDFGTPNKLDWDFGDLVPSAYTTSTTIVGTTSHTYPLNTSCATSVYTVSVKITTSLGKECVKTQVISIQNPNLNNTHAITYTLTNACKTFSLSYDNGPISNAQWNFGDGSYSPVITNGVQTITHTYPAAGTYVITLTGDGIDPCFIAKQIVVTDFVVADFNFQANDPCHASAGFIWNILNYDANYQYTSTINGHAGSVPVQNGNSISPYLVDGYNVVKLTVTNPLTGCVTDITKVMYLGTPSTSFSVASQSLCSGDMLSVSGLNYGGDQYVWTIKKPDNTITTLLGMNPMYVFNPNNLPSLAGIYTITLDINTVVNDPSVSSGTIICTSSPTQHTVAVNSIPNSHFSIAPSSCSGNISLNIPTSAFNSYTLNYGDGSLPITAGNPISPSNQNHSYSVNGVYTVSLTLDNNGCKSFFDKSVPITSVANINIQASETNICPNSNAILSALITSIPSGVGTLNYYWTGPNNFSAITPTISVSQGGTYNLQVTSTGGTCILNLNASKTINIVNSPNVNILDVKFLNCSSATASATLQIPQGLLNDGYCINGNCVAGNPSANSSQNVVVSNLVEGYNYITIANALNPECNVVKLANAVREVPVFDVIASQPNNCGASGSAEVNMISGSPIVKWYKLIDYPASSYATGYHPSNALSAGSYVAEATEGYCVSKSYFDITPPVINVSTTNNKLATCAGNTLPVTLNASYAPSSTSGTSFNFNWQKINSGVPTSVASGSGSSDTQDLIPGDYVVHVSGNGCTTNFNFTIAQYDPIVVSFTSNSPNCKFQGQVDAAASGGDGNYNYQWTINSVVSTSTTASLNLGFIQNPAVVTVTVTDLSGCVSNSAPITITPATPVTLVACVPTGTGNVQATYITNCDIHTCVTGGTAPYTFEWYKVGEGTRTVEWTFSDIGNQFIASNGTNTFVIPNHPASSSSVDVNACKQDYNEDKDPLTVCYPSWDFVNNKAIPSSTIAVTMTSGASTYTVAKNVYFTVVETVTIAAQEFFVAASSGVVPTATASTKNFTSGNYNVHVTDANGCTYVLPLGELEFVKPNTFGISFSYVWGMNPVPTATIAPANTPDPVLAENMIEAANALSEESNKCMAKQSKDLVASLKSKCSDLTNFKDDFSIEYILKEHHYTLYYYDRAGQLTKTVPPEGVKFLSSADITAIKNYRKNGTGSVTNYLPAHTLKTMYHYNSFGQLLNQETPDGGESSFIYDSKNRLRFSQNKKQKLASPSVYSYTKYDDLGRIIEVGESSLLAGLDFNNLTAGSNLTNADNKLFPASVNNKQITHTVYSDQSAVTYYGKPQRFLQNRVSYTYIDEDPSNPGDEQYTYYSYDSHGNVEWLIQDNVKGIGKNYIRYEYDLVSGKVLQVAYNEHRMDRFYHKYQYDAENRLTKTLTSRDGELWDEDASYQYYAHGPLKRNVIGEDHVQGLDYIYTIQGWLKSINTPHLNTGDDPGQDFGKPLANWNTGAVAEDRNGMVLNYFNGDYKTHTNNFLTSSTNYSPLLASVNYTDAPGAGLYNGNISSWSQSQINTSLKTPDVARTDFYKYDVLNRIKEATSYKQTAANSTSWTGFGTSNQAFKSQYDYDANGNILALKRYDNNGLIMDDLAYTYDNGTSGAAINSNQLIKVEDVNSVQNTNDDIVGTHNYQYDGIGNLIIETGEERLNIGGVWNNYLVNTNISWTVYGKIKEVLKTVIVPGGSDRKTRITFSYDASGNRTTKEVWKDAENSATPANSYDGIEQPEELKTTYYVRDAQGNTMAVYDKYYDSNAKDANDIAAPVFKYELQEQPIYGSERIGQNVNRITLSSSATLAGLQSPASVVNTLSEYENWITTTNKSSVLPVSMDDNLCQCKIKTLTSNSSTNPNYNNVSDAVEFLGIANNGIAVAENLDGELQFYAVLAKKYLGNGDACLIFDKEGRLMKGTENISVPDVNSKPVIINITGSNSYAVVNLNAAHKPVYHVIDMDAIGYSPLAANKAGEVVAHDLTVSTSTVATAKQGYHFTGIEDHINGQSIVYSSRYTPNELEPNKGVTEILAYDFGNSASNIPQEHLLYTIPGCGSTEIGELQISPNGDKLAWYQHDKSISGFKHRLGYIYTFSLTPNKLSIATTPDIKPTSQAGNFGNGMLEFMSNNTDILYSQRGLYAEGAGARDKNVWRYEPLNTSSTLSAINQIAGGPLTGYLFGEIRRGVDGKLYIPNMGEPADKIHSYSNNTGTNLWNTDIEDLSASALTYQLASALPTQVFKLFIDPNQTPQQYLRAIQKKEYELKDHLGNVKMVISDAKLVSSGDDIIDAGDNMIPEILSYTDYYPFGSTLPSLKFSNTTYRYGFNGKENDPETGTQDYGMRIYDGRIAKFLSVDPLARLYPYMSSYLFAANNPILFIDYEGAGVEPPTISKAVKSSPKILKSDVKAMQELIKEANDLLKAPKPQPPNPILPIFARLHPLLKAALTLSMMMPTLGESIKSDYNRYIERGNAYKEMSSWQCQSCVQSDIRAAMARLKGLTIVNSNGEIEHFGADPSKLSDEYLRGVMSRVESGNARGTDWSYVKEAYSRLKGSTFKTDDEDNVGDQKMIVEFIQGQGDNALKIAAVVPEGYTKTNYTIKGQKIFTNGDDFISPDVDGHNGGIWKKASSVKNLGKKETRDGTYDSELNKVGD